MTPIIQLGNKRALRVKDLYNVLPKDESEKLGLELERLVKNTVFFTSTNEAKLKNEKYIKLHYF